MATIRQVAVIVAQDGAEASPSMEALKAGASTVLLLAQEPGESLRQLSHRVRARLSALLKEGYSVQSATFVAKNGFYLSDVLPTSDMLRALVSTMVAYGSGSVRLHATGKDTRSHFALAALANAIADQVRGTGVEIVMAPPRPHPVHVASASVAEVSL